MIEVKVERIRKKARLDESYDEDIQDTDEVIGSWNIIERDCEIICVLKSSKLR